MPGISVLISAVKGEVEDLFFSVLCIKCVVCGQFLHRGIAVRALPVFVELKPPSGPDGRRGRSGGRRGFLFCKMFSQEGGTGPPASRPGRGGAGGRRGGTSFSDQNVS